jgi:hypothetical protein
MMSVRKIMETGRKLGLGKEVRADERVLLLSQPSSPVFRAMGDMQTRNYNDC